MQDVLGQLITGPQIVFGHGKPISTKIILAKSDLSPFVPGGTPRSLDAGFVLDSNRGQGFRTVIDIYGNDIYPDHILLYNIYSHGDYLSMVFYTRPSDIDYTAMCLSTVVQGICNPLDAFCRDLGDFVGNRDT
ncbi:hypothetical protein PFICI_10495 [Pestalotiopsis fici W106-1]|uniref:Uncharacterized protein n=1 Tax=Pestalotiopsis fici (strain W106-1 / CGMCC3.15140) TaxID=1229662 RepID=W3WX27_PESFW|nr:uncharacterized protein PFICI_10495 [Pestalotiopsis fici W106-1]ETS78433.1 hypothetical protein PFICI_10495 [Pestalotiopsis fici W106-1]